MSNIYFIIEFPIFNLVDFFWAVSIPWFRCRNRMSVNVEREILSISVPLRREKCFRFLRKIQFFSLQRAVFLLWRDRNVMFPMKRSDCDQVLTLSVSRKTTFGENWSLYSNEHITVSAHLMLMPLTSYESIISSLRIL